jgi:hypothetical protein
MSVSDATRCAKKGSFQPSMNSSDDHETGLAAPKLRQNPPQENPRQDDPRKPAPAESQIVEWS